jgi:hypothetical protein
MFLIDSTSMAQAISDRTISAVAFRAQFPTTLRL